MFLLGEIGGVDVSVEALQVPTSTSPSLTQGRGCWCCQDGDVQLVKGSSAPQLALQVAAEPGTQAFPLHLHSSPSIAGGEQER